ncbi:MAG: Fic family protein [Defluviitaleaceae bacterium]|nr:Fic family protein [Defluviitaleaceae bacterium]
MNIRDILQEIDALKAVYASAPKIDEAVTKKRLEQFMVENTYNSNAIEGNSLTLRETATVILEGVTIDKKPVKDHLEAIGHKDAFIYVVDMVKDDVPFSLKAVRDIHSLVLMNDAKNRGQFRQYPVEILGSSYMPPPPEQVPILMGELMDSYNTDNRHPIEKISDFHIRFERIHPFIDGNGRSGRLILNLELMRAGYAPVDIKFKDRDVYYACFDDYDVNGKADMFIGVIAKYELEEMKKLAHLATYAKSDFKERLEAVKGEVEAHNQQTKNCQGNLTK